MDLLVIAEAVGHIVWAYMKHVPGSVGLQVNSPLVKLKDRHKVHKTSSARRNAHTPNLFVEGVATMYVLCDLDLANEMRETFRACISAYCACAYQAQAMP